VAHPHPPNPHPLAATPSTTTTKTKCEEKESILRSTLTKTKEESTSSIFRKMKKTKQNFQFDDKILISIVAFKRQQKCIFYVAFPPLEKNIGMDISSHVPVIFYHVYVQRLN